MIDTLGIHLSGGVRNDVPLGWKRSKWSEGIVNNEGKFIALPSGLLRHGPTGLRIGVSGGEVCWAEVELPRFIFQHNGILIKTQKELDQATARFLELVTEACVLRPKQPLNLRRIDLVGHAPISPAMLIGVYKHFRLPAIRKDPIHYPGTGLLWQGAHRKCRIYDKKLKQQGQEGDIARIEWELHGTDHL